MGQRNDFGKWLYCAETHKARTHQRSSPLKGHPLHYGSSSQTVLQACDGSATSRSVESKCCRFHSHQAAFWTQDDA